MSHTTDRNAALAAAPSPRVPLLVAGAVLIAGLTSTWHLWRGAQADAAADLQAHFDYRAREVVNQIAQRVGTQVQLVRSVQGLYASSERVTWKEFSDYVRSQDIEQQVPGVRGVGYVPAVPHAQLAEHLAWVRREVGSGYAIRPAGVREFYAPVSFIEPLRGQNLRIWGYDVWSDPARKAVLERARDSGQPALSGRTLLAQDGSQAREHGYLIAMPLYARGAPTATEGERRAALTGWVGAPFWVAALLAGLPGERSSGLRVELYDGGRAVPEARMLSGAEPPRQDVLLLSADLPIAKAGHVWTARVGAEPTFVARHGSARPHIMLAAGLAGSLALSILALMLARSYVSTGAALVRTRRMASELQSGQQRLAQVAESAQRARAMMESILDATQDAIFVDSGERRILAANERFRQMWAIPEAIDLAGPDQTLVEHLVNQLHEPAPYLYARALDYTAGQVRTELLRLKDGRFLELHLRAIELGHEVARLWSFRDITERKHVEQRERSHRHVLELLARGAPLQSILDAVVLGVEAANPGLLCSIVLLAPDGRHIRTGAAPSLPAEWNETVNHLEIGPDAGACGSSIHLGRRVVVTDISRDPHWAEVREQAAQAGLASCWSEPIRGSSGRILGSFAIYHRVPHSPGPAHILLIEQAAQLAGIALEQADAVQAARIGEQRFRSLYENAPVALWEQDWREVRAAWEALQASGVGDLAAHLRSHPEEAQRLAKLVRIKDVNRAALAQVGAPGKDVSRLTLEQNFGDVRDGCFAAAVAALAEGEVAYTTETSFLRLDGAMRQNEVTLLVMPGHARLLDFVIVSTLDITERKAHDAELVRMATTDFMTGLPNRRAFMERLQGELARVQRNLDEGSVLLIDVDHFKQINDRHGHAVGDAMLRHLADVMRHGQRRIDTLGRMGGEEFAVLLPGADEAAAFSYAERLRRAVESTPLEVEGERVPATISIGIARLLASDRKCDAVLVRADRALYAAKEGGRNQVRVQDAETNVRSGSGEPRR
jgi:diguanylate cyclase (GGDEF)-like protein